MPSKRCKISAEFDYIHGYLSMHWCVDKPRILSMIKALSIYVGTFFRAIVELDPSNIWWAVGRKYGENGMMS